MSVPPAPPPGVAEEVWFKNRLQQYTQRASMPLPIYQTLFEGSPQAPSFRAQVWVDGTCFTSPSSFSTRKMAEQDAAKHALIGIREKVKNEGSSFILQDTFFCKSIIHEYATKMNLTPRYVTNQSEAMLPIFVSSLVLNGFTYVGDAGKNKREAEQLAARSAILSILGSESSTTMSEKVKSKFRFYESLKKVKDLYGTSNTVPTEISSLKDINNSSDVQGGNIPAEVNALEAPFSVNKRKEVDVSGGTATGSSAPISQSCLSTITQLPATELQGGNILAGLNALVAPFSVNKRKEVDVSGGTATGSSAPISQSGFSTITQLLATQVQSGNIPAGVNALEAPFSVNKRKEVDVSGGTATGSSAPISQSCLSTITHLPAAQVQGGNIPAGVNALESPFAVNKMKEVDVSGGTATVSSAPISQSCLSTITQLPAAQVWGGNIPAGVNALESPFAVNKMKEVVSGGTAAGSSAPISQSCLSTITQLPAAQVQGGNIPAGVKALEAPFTFNKMKEVDVCGGTATGSSAPISQSSLSTITQLPAIQRELPVSTLDQPSNNTQVKGQPLHEFKKPKLTSSSAAIAPPIVFVPPASEQAMTCSALGKKRNRRNKKAKKKMEHESLLLIVMIPLSQLSAFSVAQ